MVETTRMHRGLLFAGVIVALAIFSPLASGASKTEPAADVPPLIAAVRAGDVEKAKTLLDDGADVNVADANGWTALHGAVVNAKKTTAFAALLVGRGGNVNTQDKTLFWSPLHLAASAGNNEAVEFLLKNGADLNLIDKYGFTPLHRAAFAGDDRSVELLLKNGGDPNARAKGAPRRWVDNVLGGPGEAAGYRPLHCALEGGKSAGVVGMLISHGADVNAKAAGCTPLDLVSKTASPEVVAAIQSKGGVRTLSIKTVWIWLAYGQFWKSSLSAAGIAAFLFLLWIDGVVWLRFGGNSIRYATDLWRSREFWLGSGNCNRHDDERLIKFCAWALLVFVLLTLGVCAVFYWRLIPGTPSWVTRLAPSTVTGWMLFEWFVGRLFLTILVAAGGFWLWREIVLPRVNPLVAPHTDKYEWHLECPRCRNHDAFVYTAKRWSSDGYCSMCGLPKAKAGLILYCRRRWRWTGWFGSGDTYPERIDKEYVKSVGSYRTFYYEESCPARPLMWDASDRQAGTGDSDGVALTSTDELCEQLRRKGICASNTDALFDTTLTVQEAAYLIGHGADVNATRNAGFIAETPLRRAVCDGRPDLVELYLERGAKPNPDGGVPILCDAARRNGRRSVLALLKHGADIRAKDEQGWTVLHWAIEGSGSAGMTALLIEHGADGLLRDKDGHFDLTPLAMAAERGRWEVVRVILEHIGVEKVEETWTPNQVEKVDK